MATNDVNFWRQLGYSDVQIHAFTHDNALLYSLGPMPFDAGDVTAANPPALDALSVTPSSFYLLPRREDLILQAEAYIHECPATPSALKTVLDTLIVNLNQKYRFSVLSTVHAARYIYPENSRAEYDPNTGLVATDLYPYNIFPIVPSYDGEAVELEVNTKANVGSVRNITFGERNIFGFSNVYNGWDMITRRYKSFKVASKTVLGVRGQICEISSTQLFQSRAHMTGDSVNASIVALFLAPGQPTTFPMTFFPKNLLSSSVSYNTLDFAVCSRYVHPTMLVTKEEYEYILLIEIRNVD